MKRIFIIRHGRTAWNQAKRLQGASADSPLLTMDLTPYRQLAHYLAAYRFARVYTSPLARAADTARIVTQAMGLTVPIQPLAAFKELSFGQWEGKRRAELVKAAPELFAKLSRRENDPTLQALGVERFDFARRRFVQGVQTVVAQMPPDTNALVFSHGGISQLGIKAATSNEHLLGLKNLSTSILAVKADQFYLDVYNQTAYLDHVDLDEGNVSIL